MDDIEFKTAAEMVMEKDIEEKLDKLNLKAIQCKGGRDAWITERRAALTIAHILMEKSNIDFKDANKKAWAFVIKERQKPCVLPNKEPMGKREHVGEPVVQEPTDEEQPVEHIEQVEQVVDAQLKQTSAEEKLEEIQKEEL